MALYNCLGRLQKSIVTRAVGLASGAQVIYWACFNCLFIAHPPQPTLSLVSYSAGRVTYLSCCQYIVIFTEFVQFLDENHVFNCSLCTFTTYSLTFWSFKLLLSPWSVDLSKIYGTYLIQNDTIKSSWWIDKLLLNAQFKEQQLILSKSRQLQ